jgi:hypothetical protein
LTEPPLCECHGIPQYWHKRKGAPLGGYWRCREKRKALDAARWESYYYERMPATIRIPRVLQTRRHHALQSRRRRERQRMEA